MQPVEYSSSEQTQVLRIHIDGEWSIGDFGDFFNDLEYLITIGSPHQEQLTQLLKFRILQSELIEGRFPFASPSDGDRQARMVVVRYFRQSHPALEKVKRISFASPGVVDIAGVGKLAKVIKDIIFGVTDRILDADMRAAKLEAQRQKNIKAMLANANQLIAIGNKLKMTDETKLILVREVLAIEHVLEGMVEKGKLKKVEIIDN